MEIENRFGETTTENAPNPKKKTDIQVEEAQRSQTRWTQTDLQQNRL